MKKIKTNSQLLVLLMSFVIMNHAQAQSSSAQNDYIEYGNEEGESGELQFTNSTGEVFTALHLNTEVSIQINGMVAQVNYIQTFRNDSADWVEGMYLFPLPETAAVNAMEMRLQDKIIKGLIKQKKEARKIYQQAKASGQRASLVEQQRPNMFTQKVSNIGPGESLEISITYLQKVTYEQGQFSIRLPLTITPRYIPGKPLLPGSPLSNNTEIELGDRGWGWSAPTEQVSDADFITPHMATSAMTATGELNNPVSINVELNAGLELSIVDSAYHEIDVSRQQQNYLIALSKGQVAMDRDFVLRWRVVASQAPSAALFTEEVENETYLMMMLLPPEQQEQGNTLAREVTFIVDTSGSMDGSSIVQAKSSLQMALQTLSTQDRFNIIEFNSVYTMLSPQAVPANNQYLEQGRAYVSRLSAKGGTEMYPALEAALSQPAAEGFLKQIVFITDGSVGNEQELFSLIHNKLGAARLFTVGIGSAPNSHFMRKAAEFGRGTFTYVGSNNEVAEQMSGLFRQLQSPVLRDLNITWPSNMQVEMLPFRVPDLYYGQPLLVSAKVSNLNAVIEVTGQSSVGQWQQSLTLNPQAENHIGIASLWARDKIAALLDEKITGVDEAIIKPQVVKVALRHQLMSPYTSFVAVEEKIVRPVNKPLKAAEVPNLLALGQKIMPHTTVHSYPQGALGLRWNMLLACLSLMLALFFSTWNPHHESKH